MVQESNGEGRYTLLKDNFSVIHNALASIYIAVGATTYPSDIHDSRPRVISDEVAEAYINLAHALEQHFNVAENSFVEGARPKIRSTIGLSGFNIGYDDEGLNLAQMVTRASPTGWGMQYQSDIYYRH